MGEGEKNKRYKLMIKMDPFYHCGVKLI
jgi:hypothetical protein